MRPLVTVVIDTYNQEKYIEDAITSVLAQDFPLERAEILVVDDGSTDRTAEIVRKFEPRVRLLQKKNGGQASAINFGIANANGDVVAFLDGDDLWQPTKLSRVMEAFTKDGRVVMVYHPCSFFNAAEGWTWEMPLPLVSGDILKDNRKLLMYRGAATSSIAFRKSALERLAPIPERCSFMHDIYLVGSVVYLGDVTAINETLTRYRVHGQNLCFAEKGQPDPEVLKRRLATWGPALESLQQWIRWNAPRETRAKARILTRKWELARERDAIAINRTGRFRFFAYRCRANQAESWTMTRWHLAYEWVHACFELVVGRENAHYLGGVRRRVKRLFSYFDPRVRTAQQERH